jgi:hypothetical protein
MEALTGGHDAAIQMIDSLAWKPDDERGANGQLGANLAPARDASQSFFPNGGALHALEHALGRMLKRDAQ